ncbi:hypothetical protein ACBR19_20585 [Raoultella planticola]|uniref:hypothetical protein n=1 Tax=Raoultella planticola TaxID=575 RepID=UPI0035266F1C
MSKIENPVVLIHKRDNNDSYAVAITSGSKNFHDAVLMASMEPDMVGDDVDTWSKTGYYMAQEIELWRRAGALAISRLDAADDSDVWQAVGFVLGALECAAMGQVAGESNNCRSSENVQVLQAGNSPVIGIDLASGPDHSVEVRYVAPPGYVMVPNEPSKEMAAAFFYQKNRALTGLNFVCSDEDFGKIYEAMLAAAPQGVE